MSNRRFPIGVLAIVPVVIGMGVWAFTGQAQVEDPSVAATATAQAENSLTPIDPSVTITPEWWVDSPPPWTPEPTVTPWPTPQASHGAFHDGAWVRANAGEGDCLNARNTPGVAQEWTIINVCLPHGYEGLISGETQQADGHWWWYLAGLGYVAEDYLTYVGEFDARANRLGDLAGKGRVAFLRGRDIWLMDADGANQTLTVDLDDNEPNGSTWRTPPQNLAWSPDGRMLSYNLDQPDNLAANGMPMSELHILSVADGTARVYDGVFGGGWSADSARLGIVREASGVQMSDSVEGIPGVLDLATGGQLVLGSERLMQQKAPSFNFDGSLLMVTSGKYDEATQKYEAAIVVYDTSGVEVHRISMGENVWFASPRWSPVANRIAMHYQEQDSPQRYRVYDLASAAFVAGVDSPKMSDRLGGRCGGGDMWDTRWSADGRHVMYSFDLGDNGANGIWIWDVAAGTQTIVSAASSGDPVPGPADSLMYSAWGGDERFIFVGTTAGGLPRLLTDGSNPVWHYER